ncbi:hypothetical protein D8B26_004642 [Coccidioides posadasii str. Silveira]|nr:hypothetical protein D8B26_004642 [Coccidioides posadasii str. Silveira]
MKTVVDNFAVLAIEQCILKKLPLIFNPEVITNLDDKTLEAIAAETTESKVERSHALEKLKFLSPALQNLKRLAFRRGGHYSDVIRVKGSIYTLPATRSVERVADGDGEIISTNPGTDGSLMVQTAAK